MLQNIQATYYFGDVLVWKIYDLQILGSNPFGGNLVRAIEKK